MSAQDGGPAFPHEENAQHWERAGMSLRDYFAAKALGGLCSDSESISDVLGKVKGAEAHPLDLSIAVMAYRYADAMLKARGA